MRRVFWLTALVALGLVILGLTVFPSPDIANVPGQKLDDWYTQQTLWAMIAGVLFGGGGAWLARSRIRHRPHEQARAFHSRVGSSGFWTAVATAVVTIAASAVFAANAVFIPLGSLQRVIGMAASGRFLAIAAAAALTATVVFALATRASAWGGQYALLNPNLTPNLAD